jgi:hypothetical protein
MALAKGQTATTSLQQTNGEIAATTRLALYRSQL